MKSESIKELVTALSKAQGAMAGAVTDSVNPFYKSKYADLASVWKAIREPLANNGLSVVQGTEVIGEGELIVVSTLFHESGEWIKNILPIGKEPNKKQGLQELGKEITYARRYLLSAQVGVYQVDCLDADPVQGGDEDSTNVETKTETTPQDDISYSTGNADQKITGVQATEFRKKCFTLGISTADSKKFLKAQSINTVDDIPLDSFENLLKELHTIKDSK